MRSPRLIAALALTTVFGARGGAAQTPCANRALAACSEERVRALVRAHTTLDSLAAFPAPSDASALVLYDWLRRGRARVGALIDAARKRTNPLPRGMPSPRPTFDQQVQTAQRALLVEGAKLKMLSGTLKTRHGVAMNAIRNIR